jgi:hypothetical protein
MSVQVSEDLEQRIVSVRVTGKLTKEDYSKLVPEVETALARSGKINMEFDLHDFHGWAAGALWEDVKFDVKHFSDIGRVAIIGDKKWEHGLAVFAKPFTAAKIKYFDRARARDAETWLAVHE